MPRRATCTTRNGLLHRRRSAPRHQKPEVRNRSANRRFSDFWLLISGFCRGTRDWWSQTGSNRRPHACKARALPTELWPRAGGAEIRKSEIRSQNANLLASDFWVLASSRRRRLVGLGGLEPPTSRLSSARSNQLSYKPFGQKPEVRRSEARKSARRLSGFCR